MGTLQRADQTILAIALCGMGFFGNMAWGPFLAVPAEIFTPEVYGKAMGFVNGIGYFSAAFSAKIFAALVVVQNGQKNYSSGWYFLCSCVVIGVAAAAFIRTPKSVAAPQLARSAAGK
jgi:sugar phosphate permease